MCVFYLHTRWCNISLKLSLDGNAGVWGQWIFTLAFQLHKYHVWRGPFSDAVCCSPDGLAQFAASDFPGCGFPSSYVISGPVAVCAFLAAFH